MAITVAAQRGATGVVSPLACVKSSCTSLISSLLL
jgi:hypothetical protein